MLTLIACSDIAVEGSPNLRGPGGLDTFSPPTDGFFGADAPDNDASTDGDTGPDANSTPRGELIPAAAKKSAPGFVVPAVVAQKRSLAVNDQLAAWVEVSDRGVVAIVTWDLLGEAFPFAHVIDGLVAPSQLAVGDGWVAYIDTATDPDGDLFALEVATGTVTTVAATPRFQRRPVLRGSLLAWEDCRDCSPTASRPPSTIYLTDLAAGPDTTTFGAPDAASRFPRFGTLADGAPAIVWMQGALGFRVRSLGDGGAAVDGLFPANDYDSEGATLSGGTLVHRPQPTIINPDSMIPTEPWALNLLTGVGAALATDQNIQASSPSQVVTAGGRFAWLRQASPDPTDMEIVVVSPAGAVDTVVVAPGATEIVGGGGWFGFVAPRADNEGEGDVWLFPVP